MKNNHRSGTLDVSALHLLHRAGQCAEVLFTNETGKADLTPRQYAILTSVAQNPDISQTGLVEQTGVDRSTLADIVRRLVKKGLLQRKRTRRDARMYAVRLTSKGNSSPFRHQSGRRTRRPAPVVCARQRRARRLHRGAGRDRQGHEPPRRASTESLGCPRPAAGPGSPIRQFVIQSPQRRRAGHFCAASPRQGAVDDGAGVGPIEPLAVGLARRGPTAAWR